MSNTIWLDQPDSSGNWLVKTTEGNYFDAEVKEGATDQVRIYGYDRSPDYCGDSWSCIYCCTGYFNLKWCKTK